MRLTPLGTKITAVMKTVIKRIRYRLSWAGVFVLLLAVVCVAKPSGGGKWSFAVLGDSRNGPETFQKILRLVAEDPTDPEMLFHTGDMVKYGNRDKAWKSYRRHLSILGDAIEVYPVVGNHDVLMDKEAKNYKRYAKPPEGKLYYKLKHKNAGFIVLNSYEENFHGAISPEQMKWLRGALEEMKGNADPIFAFIHKPLVTRETYRHPEPLDNHDEINRVLREGGVDAVFMGHEHRFDHMEHEGIHYFVAAGAGAPLYGEGERVFNHYCRVEVGKSEVTVTAVDTDGNERFRVLIPLDEGEGLKKSSPPITP